MDAQKVDMFIMSNSQFFPKEKLGVLQSHLLSLDETQFAYIQTKTLKNPTTALILSLLAGIIGVDRFYIGDIGMGIFKLLTYGGFIVIAIMDLFTIMGKTREKNFKAIMNPYA